MKVILSCQQGGEVSMNLVRGGGCYLSAGRVDFEHGVKKELAGKCSVEAVFLSRSEMDELLEHIEVSRRNTTEPEAE